MADTLICPLCGGALQWDSDQNAADVCDGYDENDTAVISYYTCGKCGRSYEICDPPKKERENEYKDYWNG